MAGARGAAESATNGSCNGNGKASTARIASALAAATSRLHDSSTRTGEDSIRALDSAQQTTGWALRTLNRLESEKEDLKSALANSQEIKRDNQELRASREMIREQNKQLRESDRRANERVRDLEGRLDSLEDRLKSRLELIYDLKSSNSTIGSQLETVTSANQDLTSQAQKLLAKLGELGMEIVRLEAKHNAALQAAGTAQALQARAEAQLEVSQKLIRELDAKVEVEREERMRREERIAQLEKRVEASTVQLARFNDLEIVAKLHEADKRELRAKNRQLEKELIDCKAALKARGG